ncbi:hypothetical protein HMPREF0973_02103 [Prevotella veroralis F0319]|uniref:Uncharacterized protein n=1 Tax=Prevotella veroralis F0319 TaxID=649761 RepID=C9MR68_9BACT|nr:hypothetical protein HMPREF0973_02103 [Prevotella veroralis F0319]
MNLTAGNLPKPVKRRGCNLRDYLKKGFLQCEGSASSHQREPLLISRRGSL